MKKHGIYTLGSLIILLISAFVFVLLPAMTGNSGGQDQIPTFGKYKGKEIRYEQGSDFANFVSRYGQMMQYNGQEMDQSTHYSVFNYAFNSTVMRMAYTDAVKKSGYTIPNTAINREMVPYFYDETGNYSSKIYKQTDASTIQDIKSEVISGLYATRYYDDNFGSEDDILGYTPLYGLKESDKELDFLNDMNYSKRGFDFVSFATADYPDEEKVAFGKAHADKFNQFDMSIISVSDESTINKIAKRLDNNEITFEDAISEYSEKMYSTTEGNLTYKYQYQIETMLSNKDDLDTILSLPVGSISPILETSSCYFILKNNAAMTKPDFDNSDIIMTVGNYISIYEKSTIEDYFSSKAKDFKAAALSTDFDSACEQFNLTKKTIATFPLNYGNSSIYGTIDTTSTGLTGADTNENFLKTAFSLKLNELSEPVVIGDNVIVLKYTAEDFDTTDDANISVINQFDESSVEAYFMDGPNLENHFMEVYFDNFVD